MSLVLIYLEPSSVSCFEYLDFQKYSDKTDSKSKE